MTSCVTSDVHGHGPSKASIVVLKLAEIEEFKKRVEQAENCSDELEIAAQVATYGEACKPAN